MIFTHYSNSCLKGRPCRFEESLCSEEVEICFQRLLRCSSLQKHFLFIVMRLPSKCLGQFGYFEDVSSAGIHCYSKWTRFSDFQPCETRGYSMQHSFERSRKTEQVIFFLRLWLKTWRSFPANNGKHFAVTKPAMFYQIKELEVKLVKLVWNKYFLTNLKIKHRHCTCMCLFI